MKILIMMNIYRSMDVAAVQTFTALLTDIFNRGDKIITLFSTTAHIAISRQKLWEVAAQKCGDYDYAITLDDDHLYSSKAMYNLIEKMEKNALPMLAAAYFTKDNTGNSYAMLKKNEAGVLAKLERGTAKGIVDADVVGLGFCVMKSSFVYDMYMKHKKLFDINNENGIGEDVYFCNLVKAAGYPVRFDADTVIGHIKTTALY